MSEPKLSEQVRHSHHPDCLFVSDESAGCECGANEMADKVAVLEAKLEQWEAEAQDAKDPKVRPMTKLEHTLMDAQATIGQLEAKPEAMEHDYHELLFAVITKHTGETRHETALRYITERESRELEGSAAAQKEQTDE